MTGGVSLGVVACIHATAEPENPESSMIQRLQGIFSSEMYLQEEYFFSKRRKSATALKSGGGGGSVLLFRFFSESGHG